MWNFFLLIIKHFFHLTIAFYSSRLLSRRPRGPCHASRIVLIVPLAFLEVCCDLPQLVVNVSFCPGSSLGCLTIRHQKAERLFTFVGRIHPRTRQYQSFYAGFNVITQVVFQMGWFRVTWLVQMLFRATPRQCGRWMHYDSCSVVGIPRPQRLYAAHYHHGR